MKVCGYRTLICSKTLKEELSETQGKDPGQEAAKERKKCSVKEKKKCFKLFFSRIIPQKRFHKV